MSQALGGEVGRLGGESRRFSATRVAASAVVGGTISALSGGKFANGAITGAFSRAFNDEAHWQESKEIGQTFAERAGIYRAMQAKLDAAGVDTVWFGVAADLNDFFGRGGFLLASSHDYMNELGISLLAENIKMFNQLITGEIGYTGQKLDNYLVHREQMHVQSFTADRYGTSVPLRVRFPVNLAFNRGLFAMPSNIRSGVNYVERRFNEGFNYWDTSHRMLLGESMMSIARHEN